MCSKVLSALCPRKSVNGYREKVIKLASGNAAGQAIMIAASPILTRLYSPADFGVFAVYLSIISIALVITSFRMETALVIPLDNQEATDLLAVCLVLVLATTVVSCMIVWFAQDLVLGWMREPRLRPYLWVVPFSILGGGIYQTYNYWCIRKQGFARIGRTRVTQSIAKMALQIFGGLAKVGPIGLLVGDTIGRAYGTQSLVSLEWQKDLANLRNVTWANMLRVLVRYRNFPLISCGAALINSFNLQLPALLLAIYFSPAAAGCFVLAQRLYVILIVIFGDSVGQVYLSEFAKIPRSGHHEMLFLLKRTIRKLFLINFPIIMLMALVGYFLFPYIFGKAWKESAAYLVALVPMSLAQISCASVGGTLVILERQDLLFYREIIRALLVVSAVFLGYFMHLSPLAAVMLISVNSALAYMVYGLTAWYAINATKVKV